MSSKNTNQRINFASIKNPLEFPDFLEIQLKSFQDFLQLDAPPESRKNEGLYKVFTENFPITDTRNNFVLEFLDYYVDPPRYTIDECINRGAYHSVPLKAKHLYCTDLSMKISHGDSRCVPWYHSLHDRKRFICDQWCRAVIVSQLHRSPGVFFGQSIHANGTILYSARVIPFKGSWIEFATDIHSVMYAYIDRKRKCPLPAACHWF